MVSTRLLGRLRAGADAACTPMGRCQSSSCRGRWAAPTCASMTCSHSPDDYPRPGAGIRRLRRPAFLITGRSFLRSPAPVPDPSDRVLRALAPNLGQGRVSNPSRRLTIRANLMTIMGDVG